MWNSVVLILSLAAFRDAVLASKPHIIFILADDLGWNDVGFHGSNQIPTPNIDALAYTGIILNNYYVTPICTPSRSALMTGKYPIHTGLQHGVIHGWAPYGLDLNVTLLPQFLKTAGYVSRAVGKWHLGMQYSVIIANEPWGLGQDQRILPQFLKEEGYATAALGKWHLGHFRHEYLPESRGFDSHYGYWTGHQDYFDHTAVDRPGYWGYDMRRGMDIAWSDYGNYTTDLFTDEAVQIIENHDTSKPLFLYIAHLATHSGNGYSPLQAPKETVAKFDYIEDKNRRLFAGMLSKLDDSVGAVVTALAANSMLNNSVIIFSTDNGGAPDGFDDNAASNWPLRGVKDTLWEGGVRGVGLIWSPLLPSSKVSNSLMHITDWLPTLLTMINATNIPENLDGVSVWKNLSEESSSSRKEILLNIDPKRNVSGIRYENWKYLKGHTNNWNGWYGPSGRNYTYNWDKLYNSSVGKVVRNIKKFPKKSKIKQIRSATKVTCSKKKALDLKEEAYLFDVRKDPCEQENLILDHADVVSLMESKLRKYTKTMVEPRNKPLDPRSHPKYWGYAWVNWMDFV